MVDPDELEPCWQCETLYVRPDLYDISTSRGIVYLCQDCLEGGAMIPS